MTFAPTLLAQGAGGALSWAQWLIPAGAAAAILAFYFLKTRRKPVLVPSTYLWRRTIEDRRVNAFWQRLRRNLLLLLQLLAVALAAVALARPTWSGSALRGGRYVFLIDHSASMSAVDVAPSRLEEAKRRILALIDRMGSGDAAMVVSFADQARIQQAFTDNREQLRRAVREIRPTNRATSLDEALRLCLRQGSGAAGGAQASGSDDAGPAAGDAPADLPQLFIASDGNFAQPEDLKIAGLNAVFIPVGGATSRNVGLLGFAVQRSGAAGGAIDGGPGNELAISRGAQALAKVRNFSAAERSVELRLTVDGRLVDAQRVGLEPGRQKDVLFTVADAADGLWQLTAAADDELAADDQAWAVLAPPRASRGLVVTPGNRYLEAALATDEARRWGIATFQPPGFLPTPEYRALVDSGSLDWIIFDRCRPEANPGCSTLYIGALPPGDVWRAGAKVDLPQVIDVARTHPLFENVSLGQVLIAEAVPPIGPSGAQTLVDSDRGPLSVLAPRGIYEDAVLGFAMFGADGAPLTNWPLVDGAGFEQFVLNVVQYFGRSRAGEAPAATRPGQPLRFRLEGGIDEVEVVAPGGAVATVRRGDSGEFAYYSTDQVGPYRVEAAGALQRVFAVNLFDAAESQTAVAEQPKLKIGNQELVGSQNWETARLEGWRPFLLLMLALLLVEWYIYGRRASNP